MKPRKHCLFASEGLELLIAIGLVVFPTWLSFAATPMPVIIAVSLVHVIQIVEGVNESPSRHVIVYTAAFVDVIGIVSELYDNWSSLSTAGLDPDRSTRALYIVVALVALVIIDVMRWASLDTERTEEHEEDSAEYRMSRTGKNSKKSRFNHLAAMRSVVAEE